MGIINNLQVCIPARVLEQLAVFMSLSLPSPDTSEPLKAVRREAGVARQKADQMVSYKVELS